MTGTAQTCYTSLTTPRGYTGTNLPLFSPTQASQVPGSLPPPPGADIFSSLYQECISISPTPAAGALISSVKPPLFPAAPAAQRPQLLWEIWSTPLSALSVLYCPQFYLHLIAALHGSRQRVSDLTLPRTEPSRVMK